MDKYENNDFINKYVGIWAYGYQNGFGGTEGVYNTVKSFVIQRCKLNSEVSILDIGTGVGRTAMDCAENLINSEVIGIDTSVMSIEWAKRILCNEKEKQVKIDLSNQGFGYIYINTKNLLNLQLYNISLEKLADDKQFDIVCAVNFFDRCIDIEECIFQIRKIMKNGGRLIGAMPFNFQKKKDWEKYGDKNKFISLMKKNNFVVEQYISDVVYRETLDAHGAYNEFNVDVFEFVKEEK